MRKIFFISISILCLSGLTLSAQYKPSADSLKKHVKYLSSDELQGRKAGSEGDSLAAVYICNHFANAGLTPLFNTGIQHFTLVTDVKPGSNNHLSANGKTFIFSDDFSPFSFSIDTTIKSGVVFAGFGIVGQSGNLSWDDYKNQDVKGKWVLVLRGDPEPDNSTSEFIPLSTDRAKSLTAKDKGAAGVLLVSPTSIEKTDHPVDMTFDKSVSDAGIPVISITRKTAADILAMPLTAIDSLEKAMISNKQTISFNVNTTVNATSDIQRTKAVSRNIAAILTGNDPVLKDEYIVIGAHYDHLGQGGEGSGSRMPDTVAVHHGADDNASGVASLLELAKYFAADKNKISRSIIFVAFGAEEMGIIGSRYFIDHSPVPVKSIKAMINLDMVGRLKAKDEASITISGTGTFNVADSLINILEKGRSFSVKRVTDGYGPSDHAAFYTAGIPVAFITTGAHDEYHTPFDTYEKINYPGELEITSFTADLARDLGNLKKAPIFAEAGTRREPGQYSRNLKVTLGIMPDVSGAETSGGMKVEGTRKDAPAAKAGMLKGDIITAINGMKVSNIYDYMSRLGKLKPGDIANVEILRNGKKEILIIQL